MFKHDCFIRKNSECLRKSLDLIGKRNLCNIHDGILITHSDRHYSLLDCNEIIEIMLDDGFIYCGTNEELFLAIAALRDDSDKHQWFVMDAEIYTEISKGDWFIATDIKGGKHVGTQIDPLYCHKATVEELIEHFKS